MKRNICYIGLLFLFASCSVLQNNAVVYRLDKTLPDIAFVYSLPFAKGTSHPVWQDYHSLFSHRGNFAVDFKMQPGTPIHAARGGRVVEVKEDNKAGGVGRRYVGKENSIVIQHGDGSYGHYLHIQFRGSLVKTGDTVQQGQAIGLSGNTGFSAFPHLHFEVTGVLQKAKAEIPVRFNTEKGTIFLRPLQRYKAL